MQFAQHHRDTLGEILRWRRDVRHFRREPVPEATMDRLRETMNLAPSVGNARPWRVLRVRDPALRAKVRTIFEAASLEAGKIYDDERQAAYRQLKLAGLDNAPEHLAVFTVLDPAQGHGLGRQTMHETLAQSTAMAIHTMWLAARAENLGLGMVSILDPHAVSAALDAPQDWCFSAYLCLGWPEHTDDTPLLHRAGWQENTPTVWENR